MIRTKTEVVQILEDFLSGRDDEWDWDDFTSIPIEDVDLDGVRWLCASIRSQYPPAREGQYCSDEGRAEMQRILEVLREEKG